MSKLCPSGRSEGYGIRDAEGPPLQRLRRITAGRENGRGKPLPYGTVGKHSAPEDAQKNTAPRRPFEKRAWRGLITIKCIIMYDF